MKKYCPNRPYRFRLEDLESRHLLAVFMEPGVDTAETPVQLFHPVLGADLETFSVPRTSTPVAVSVYQGVWTPEHVEADLRNTPPQRPANYLDHAPLPGPPLPADGPRLSNNVPATQIGETPYSGDTLDPIADPLGNAGASRNDAAGSPEVFPPNDYTEFEKTYVNVDDPSNAAAPSVASLDNVTFVTANWFAALSTDSGASFGYIDPYTTFPATGDFSAGFCCNQRAAHDPIRGTLFWYLQYVKSGSGSDDVGGARIAYKTSAAQAGWDFLSVTPEMFGLGRGKWLDFPQMQVSDNFLYASSNVFGTTDDVYTETVVWRIDLDQIRAGGSLTLSWFTHGVGTTSPAQGSSETMYLAARTSSTSIRLWSWPDDGSASFQEITGLATTFTETASCPDPTGDNWCAAADGRIQSGWVTKDTIGFQWNSSQGTNRPNPFIRVVELDRETKAVVAQPDLWATSESWLYGGIAANGRGDLGGVTANAEVGKFPRAVTLLRDDVSGGSWEAEVAAAGDLGHPSRWGDYDSALPDEDYNNTFIGSGFIGVAGDGTSTLDHYEVYFVHFGRERDLPSTSRPNLLGTGFDVISEPQVAGQSLTVDFTVRNDTTVGAPETTVDFYLSKNEKISPDDYLLGSTVLGGLDANTSQAGSQSLTLPPPTDPFWSGTADYRVGMIVDANSDTQEVFEGDNRNLGLGLDADDVNVIVYNDLNDQISEASDISFGVNSDALDVGIDVDLYAFTATAGQTVGFDVDSDFDSYLRLFDELGTQLDFDDDTDGPLPEVNGTEAYLEYTFNTAGTFYIGVSSFANRNYDPVTGDDDPSATTTGSYSLDVTDLTARALLVTMADDSPPDNLVFNGNTLREAVNRANTEISGANTINFDTTGVFATPQTIALAQGQLQVTDSLTINGPGAAALTVDAGGSSRIFLIDDGNATTDSPVVLRGLNLINGRTTSGGAVSSREPLTIDASNLEGNHATLGGGAVYAIATSLTVTDSTFFDNVSDFQGGAIDLLNSAFSMMNTTLTGNRAVDVGGAIHLSSFGGNSLSALIENATIVDNSSDLGSAIRLVSSDAGSNSELRIGNSILTDNSSGENLSVGTFSGGAATAVSLGHNISNDGSSSLTAAGDQLFTAPLLESLAHNGGPTRTHLPMPGSPAINAGNPATVNPSAFDQRGDGFDRVVGGVIDVGAVEAKPPIVRILGAVPTGFSSQPAYDLQQQEVAFYQFDLTMDAAVANNYRLVIDTLGSSLSPFTDTELGLFNEQGSLLASNDDTAGLLSELSFGAGGRDGDLPVGTYYLSISAFDTTFGPTGFDATSNSFNTGDFIVNFDLSLRSVDGDFDDDGDYDCDDVDALVANLAGNTGDLNFDLDGSGALDGADLAAWLDEAGTFNVGAPYLPGDANLDGGVDGGDFNIWNTHKFAFVAAWCSGDFTADGVVDGSDFSVWNLNKFRASMPASAAPAGSALTRQAENAGAAIVASDQAVVELASDMAPAPPAAVSRGASVHPLPTGRWNVDQDPRQDDADEKAKLDCVFAVWLPAD